MNPLDLAHLLATTPDHPRGRSRVLYLSGGDDGLEPAGFADAIGDVTTVLDRLDTEGADGLAVQATVRSGDAGEDGEDGDDGCPVAAVAGRDGGFALASAAARDADGARRGVGIDRPPRPDDPGEVHRCWRFVVHALAALGRPDAVPEPVDDPHPAAYLMAAWLGVVLEAATVDGEVLDRLGGLPDEPGLVAALDLPADLSGWDAVHAAATVRDPAAAARLGRNGVAWEAHVLLGDPPGRLAAVAEAGHADLADAMFADLVGRGWARRADR